MNIPPMTFAWDGEHMTPLAPRLADRHYVVGENYRLVQHEERSVNSHNHFFAAVAEAWKNLPEDQVERFPTAEHLRKWALVKSGYCDQRSVVCATKAEAQRVGSFIKPMDEFAVVIVSECVVTVYTAQSQSARAMNKAIFQKSKEDVLDVIGGLVGVSATALRQNAGQAA